MGVRGGSSFSAQIAAFAAKVERRSIAFVRAYALGLTEEIVRLSPVGDPSTWKIPPAPNYVPGHFKHNWQVSVGSIPAGTLAGVDTDGAGVLARAQSALAGLTLGPRVSIVNNVSYGARLEYGWSQQAPMGMVRVTLAQAGSIARAAAAAARGVQ